MSALDEEAANEIIMQARAHWFENEEGGEGVADEDADDVTPGENPESGEAVAHDRH